MTAFAGVFPQNTALLCTPVPVANGDTIDYSDLVNGALFVVICGTTGTNVTFVDPGKTPAGTVAGTVTPVAVAANTARVFGAKQLLPYTDPATNKVTVNYSATANTTAMVVG